MGRKWLLAGGKCIVVILAFHSLHGAGCSSPGSSDVLADPQVVVAGRAGLGGVGGRVEGDAEGAECEEAQI